MRIPAALLSAFATLLAACAQPIAGTAAPMTPSAALRVATYNASLYADEAGGLLRRLEAGDADARKVAAVLQRVRPDVVLVNEFDFDASGRAADAFQRDYLEVRQPGGGEPLRYPHRYLAPVNTGVPSGLDLDRNGHVGATAAVSGEDAAGARQRGDDSWGYGLHPGQYGMLLLSMHPIDAGAVRSFQLLPWSAMPGAARPVDPATGDWWHADDVWTQLRLSSKSHWDVPVHTPLGVVHVLASHPTPPVFDGDEDRNGRRNHDEIRLWADYVSADPTRHGYIYDDDGGTGGLADGNYFVIAGDLNADPHDGDSYPGAIEQLLSHPRVQATPVPASTGAAESAHRLGGGNLVQTSDPAHDTAVFGGNTGNLRVDYVLPSADLRVVDAGVFWPLSTEANAPLLDASDHRLVWIDIAAEALPMPAPIRKRTAR